MARSIDTIDTILKNIESRVNQLDGANLPDPAQSTVNQLIKELNGLRTTVNQAVLGMEADRQTLTERVDALEQLIQAHLGVVP